MNQLTMKKAFRSFFILIFCMLILTGLSGCGNSPDGTSTTTNPVTGYSITLTADLASLEAGSSTVVTATVTDGAGKSASGQPVTFTIPINNSGSTLTTIGGATGANGKAVAVYTAGLTNPAASVQDTIRASVTGSDSAIVITRTASAYIPPLGNQITLAADVISLAAVQNSILTATVRDGSGNPVSGQTVTFTLFINSSTASLTPSSGIVTTDASGRAGLIYTAGSTNPTSSVQDTIRASVTGSTGFVIITRTASGATPPPGYRLTLTATPVSLAANANSVLVAKVIDNASGGDASGVTVTFAIPPALNKSGAILTDIRATTDAQGYAIATYTAGNNTPSLSIQDVVTASVTGSSGAEIITRLPTVGTGNRILSFTQDPVTLPIARAGVVIMKVKVTTDNLASPVAGETVTFSIILGSGTIQNPSGVIGNPRNVLTDHNGEAYVIFTRTAASPGETVIRAQIPGTINGGDAASIVYW